jgi:hypothetical protein
LQKPALILDVFENVKQEHEIEVTTEFGVALMDVIAVQRANAAHAFLKGYLVEFESSDRYSVMDLYVSLQQAVAAADLGSAPGIPDHRIRQTPHDFETTPDPKMIEGCDIEPPIPHVHRHGRGEIRDSATLPVHDKTLFP